MTDLLYRAQLRGPLTTKTNSNETNPWAGYTVISSGVATAVVSTTNVKSDSIFNIAIGATGVSSAYMIQVRTIIDSTSFVLSRSTGAAAPIDLTVYWSLMNVK